jgi:hypothetical protein
VEPNRSRHDRALRVRPIDAGERQRFNEELERSHWLGGGLVGEVMRYIAVVDGEWAALIGFGSAALVVKARDEHIGWSEQQRWRRLRYVTNNQRFCVLEEHRRPNLASEVLSLSLRRLSTDFEERWGHPVVLVETFTDPARHRGTCYQASNFTALGRTAGFARKAGHFTHHGSQKVVWARALRRGALGMLTSDFDHPFLDPSRRAVVTAIDLNRVDLDGADGLLARLEAVPDPRMKRGVRHRVAPILSVAALATLRGAKSFNAIGDTAAELPQEALRRLDMRVSPRTGKFIAPDSSTIRRTLNDRVVARSRTDRINEHLPSCRSWDQRTSPCSDHTRSHRPRALPSPRQASRVPRGALIMPSPSAHATRSTRTLVAKSA